MLFSKSILLFISISILLNGCAAPNKKFPDYREIVENEPMPNLFIDVLMYRDILGDNKGFNEDVNREALDLAVNHISALFIEKGFTPNIINKGVGLSHDWTMNDDWVVSKDWKSTGNAYAGPAFGENNETEFWQRFETNKFLISFFSRAQEINTNYRKEKEKNSKHITSINVPNSNSSIDLNYIEKLRSHVDSDYIVFIRVHGRYQKFSKYLAKGVLVGGISAALTGGTIVSIPSGTYAKAEVSVMNLRTQKIVWSLESQFGSSEPIRKALNGIFDHYPNKNGEITRVETGRIKKPKPSPRR